MVKVSRPNLRLTDSPVIGPGRPACSAPARVGPGLANSEATLQVRGGGFRDSSCFGRCRAPSLTRLALLLCPGRRWQGHWHGRQATWPSVRPGCTGPTLVEAGEAGAARPAFCQLHLLVARSSVRQCRSGNRASQSTTRRLSSLLNSTPEQLPGRLVGSQVCQCQSRSGNRASQSRRLSS